MNAVSVVHYHGPLWCHKKLILLFLLYISAQACKEITLKTLSFMN